MVPRAFGGEGDIARAGEGPAQIDHVIDAVGGEIDAAGHRDVDVEAAFELHKLERLTHDHAAGLTGEELIE